MSDAGIGAPPMLRECPGCGELQIVPALARGMTARCWRCATMLHHTSTHGLGHSTALMTAALVLLIVMSSTTMMSVSTSGIAHSAYLLSGPIELVHRDMTALAIVVSFVTLFGPLVRLLGILYVLVRLTRPDPPRHLRRVFGITEQLRPWCMVEVFVFGVFVAYVKLGDLVHITLDPGVYALLALTFVLIWADSALDREMVWERIGGRTQSSHDLPVARAPVRDPIGCELCGFVNDAAPDQSRCARCHTHLHPRKPDSLNRTWALLLAALVMYVPANYYPVLTVVQLGAGQPATILGGVEELLADRMYPLAALVFFASIAVPMLKMLGLGIMLVSVQTGQTRWLRDRTRLYYIVRGVGRWSMIDIFMESLLGALVRFGAVVTIEPGVGAVAFCAVVILTMLAAETFDPRLMWDAAAPPHVAETTRA
jgi:paraquat-inducible protein A